MSVLEVDPISKKTLPALDQLFSSDKDRLAEIISSTSGAPLRRLLLSSIARQRFVGNENDPGLGNSGQLLESLIKENLTRDSSQTDFDAVLDIAGENAERLMLSISILRFNVLD